jgi:hypothetical protein
MIFHHTHAVLGRGRVGEIERIANKIQIFIEGFL